MKKPHPMLAILMAIYVLVAFVALWRTATTQTYDLFTLGVFPVLYGLVLRQFWAVVLLKIYLAIQTVALLALATAAIIAYQITPEDVKVVFQGRNIPISTIVISALIAMSFQYWVAFSQKTKRYFKQEE
ncbi:hypothetical protein L2729_04035 [Shewanella gelidimarina]|uniref:hypothetical protein n=1 Tax=Shewanella gelidimarina TaxID=56813 RepID=UPI00200C1AB2|nr:hypothetical protein [Shewanella gelidimarina]MCL1057161.1 hypothetical protein [Shewanella gelidimarina]